MTSFLNFAEPVTLVRSPTLTNGISGASVNGSSPESRSKGFTSGTARGVLPRTGLGDRADVLGRGAAAAADDVDEPRIGELAEVPRHLLGALVIMAELVRQAGIRIGADQRVADPRHVGDMRAHLFGAERAVQSDRDRRRVPHRVPERLGRLARQQPAERSVMVPEIITGTSTPRAALLGDGVERGLGVEGVEDGFDQQEVGAAGQQPAHLLAVGLAQIVEGDGAEAWVGHVGRDRGGAVGRPERAGDEARLAVLTRVRFAASRASRAPSQFSSEARSDRP